MRLPRVALAMVAPLLLLPAPLAGQTLSQRIRAAGGGPIHLSFAARPEVCGQGGGGIMFRDGEDQDDEWESDCERGPVRVSLRMRGGRVTSAENYVGGRWKPGTAAVDLGLVSAPDAAAVLDIDVMRLRGLVEESGRELAAEIATDVLIIEDDTFIAMELETLVEGHGHRVLGVARTHAEALALTRTRRPGLILADIQLADGSSGLDAVNELLASFEAPVIFITAYPERFLTGERPEPAFLIAKPFQPATVSAVASQALFFDRSAKRRERHVTA